MTDKSTHTELHPPARKRARELEQDLDALQTFKEALDAFADLHDWAIDTQGYSYPVLREGCTERSAILRQKVAESSGPAARVVAGRSLVVGSGTLSGIFAQAMNPIANWANAFQNQCNLSAIDLQGLRDYVDSAIGEVRSLAEQARRYERGLVGLLGRFMRFPNDVREAAGVPRHSTSGRAVYGITVLLQAGATAAVSTLVGALVARIVTLTIG